ncbi:ATP-dependent DNA helicase PIF1-like [Aphis craccivora]|uniref:ATP-dependent DNA helicase PIF1-like n=1 Tax=Aphis craccivora TaxID=307492 RepID=A0A6G0XCU7_APHCR|nr:ATP-dependent DNA helicase PIF1-like [Aphis craccivora]
MPPHVLTSKFGAPIILLRNINPLRLCNDTRLSMKNLMNNIIESKILNGNYAFRIPTLAVFGMTRLCNDCQQSTMTIVTSVWTAFRKSMLLTLPALRGILTNQYRWQRVFVNDKLMTSTGFPHQVDHQAKDLSEAISLHKS